MKEKKEKVFARVNEAEKDELFEMSEILDIPVSHIVREGLRDKVQQLKKENPKLRKLGH